MSMNGRWAIKDAGSIRSLSLTIRLSFTSNSSLSRCVLLSLMTLTKWPLASCSSVTLGSSITRRLKLQTVVAQLKGAVHPQSKSVVAVCCNQTLTSSGNNPEALTPYRTEISPNTCGHRRISEPFEQCLLVGSK